jgi:hypothetical protein
MLYFEDAFYVQGNIQKQIKLFLIQSEINEIGFLFNIYFLYILLDNLFVVYYFEIDNKHDTIIYKYNILLETVLILQ